MMHIKNPQNQFFKNLDALRFLAFLSVFISHSIFLPEPTNLAGEVWRASYSLIFLGVPFFFTLSSFLITFRLLSEAELKNSISLKSFYRNRILRIWPAYFTLIIICFLLIPLASKFLNLAGTTLPPLWPFLSFTVNFYIIKYGAAFSFALTILWSISIEEQFYLIWGVVLKFLRNNLPTVLILLLIISIAFSYVWLYYWHKAQNNLVIHSLYVVQNFVAGAALALFAKKKSNLFHQLTNSNFTVWLIPYLLLPLATVFIKEMIVLNIIKSSCFAAILFQQCFLKSPGFQFGKLDSINYLGKISYGLYLYHALVILILNRFLKQPSNTTIMLLHAVIMLLATILVSVISYEFMEKKFLKLKTRSLD